MNYTNLSFHPTMEKLVGILMKRTQNEDPIFFRQMVSYYFSKMASMMRTDVQIADSQVIPVNFYGVNLAPSGAGKGHSINIIEEHVINTFRHKFLEETFVQQAEVNLNALAVRRSLKYSTEEEDELSRAKAEFEDLGTLLFSFDSATSAALKQMRVKLQMGGSGSMNLEIDEIGSNLLGNAEALNAYLELFDTGKIKQKLIKNTRENVRHEDLFGNTPCNMLLFGTPTKLLDGSKTEEEFNGFLETGYARRCFFGFCRYRKTKTNQTPQDIYDIYNDKGTSQYLSQLSDQFGRLADPASFGKVLQMRKDVSMKLFEYRLYCQDKADSMSEYEDLRKAEMAHRYFKVAKLAAVYSYIDGDIYVTEKNLMHAIAMAEQSGNAFEEILTRDRPYAKLANYIASVGRELTHADLIEDLPFYKGTEVQKREMMSLAVAHGYKNAIYITRQMVDGIEFFSGKAVKETDLDKIQIAYSDDIATGYKAQLVKFDEMHVLTQQPHEAVHWVNHELMNGHRKEENAKPGFNMIVLDVEKSVSIDVAKELLKEYTWHIHTTKRHTDEENRFRILLPLSHKLELDGPDYKEFMRNVYDWLPFDVDTATGQRARKWLTCEGEFWYNDNELLDALQFIPKTKKAEQHKAFITDQSGLSNIERWFLRTEEGNRNNTLVRYAFILVDMGYGLDAIRTMILDLNRRFEKPLEESEILSTVLITASKKITDRGIK